MKTLFNFLVLGAILTGTFTAGLAVCELHSQRSCAAQPWLDMSRGC